MYALFVDLDGVLADFEAGVQSVTGKYPHEQHTRAMWSALARAPGFYEHLDWMSDGRELWEAVRDDNPTILTGLPWGKWAEPQKRAWCARELGDRVPVITCWTREKHTKAREEAPPPAVPVLIDDRLRIKEAWEKSGGVFIHHTSASESVIRYRELIATQHDADR